MKIYSNEEEKARRLQCAIQHEENSQKVLAKEGWLKRYRDKTKNYKQTTTFWKQRKKIIPTCRGKWTMTYHRPDTKEAIGFSRKIWERKDHNKNAEWIKKIEKELWTLEEEHQFERQTIQTKQQFHNYQARKARRRWYTQIMALKIKLHPRQTGNRNV